MKLKSKGEAMNEHYYSHQESFHSKLQNMSIPERYQVICAEVVEQAVWDIKRYGKLTKPLPLEKLSKDPVKRNKQMQHRIKYKLLLNAKAFIFGNGSTLDWYCRRIGISPAMIRRKMRDYLTNERTNNHERTAKQKGRSAGRDDSGHLGSNGF